ncbi:hypothetical protein X943_002744 [Babesia divergens]|uniref:CBF1-interacting co-repressor CIR N-terminal domain-containing protein n=1 Tax=Babesia divergens TaxID=32595 RepID=A0AAD9GFN9_BABDI|nr:hypothetical protein X943_002744 [Babesia divergens]
MGGHGGLNILPQKKWNVYRADRQFEVKYDEHRDIERRLADREKRRRERLTDSLVELRRKSQGVCSATTNYTDADRDDDDYARKSSRRRERRSRRADDAHHKDSPGHIGRDGHGRSHSPPCALGDGRIAGHVEDGPAASDPADDVVPIEFDKKVSGGHINLFEEAEREAEELVRKHRESLIKSGAYVYNAGGKGPRAVNVYTDDASVTLVPDIKEVSTPWYMRPRSEDVDTNVQSERRGGPRYLKSVATFDRPAAYAEEEELHRNFANKLAKFYSKQLPKA